MEGDEKTEGKLIFVEMDCWRVVDRWRQLGLSPHFQTIGSGVVSSGPSPNFALLPTLGHNNKIFGGDEIRNFCHSAPSRLLKFPNREPFEV